MWPESRRSQIAMRCRATLARLLALEKGPRFGAVTVYSCTARGFRSGRALTALVRCHNIQLTDRKPVRIGRPAEDLPEGASVT